MPLANKPLYLQVRDALAELISGGTWKPGFQIPSEGDLAREVGVSSGTVRKALELMEAQGLINRRQGRGSFVANPNPEELADRYCNLYGPDGVRLHGQEVKTAGLLRCTADSSERSRLHLRTGADIYRIRRVRHYNGEAFLVEDVVLPAEFFPDLLDRPGSAHETGTLAQQYGLRLGKAEERITVAIPPHDVAEILHGSPDKAIVRLDRVIKTIDGRPAEWRIAHWRMDRSYYLAEVK